MHHILLAVILVYSNIYIAGMVEFSERLKAHLFEVRTTEKSSCLTYFCRWFHRNANREWSGGGYEANSIPSAASLL